MIISKTSMRRLVTAKQMYYHGLNISYSYSNFNSILAILNFDFAVETLIKAILQDKQVSLNPKNPKKFHELLDDLKSHYDNKGILDELHSLHLLRNTIQHNASIPSNHDVIRHRSNIQFFFEDICKKIYDLKLEDISQNFLIDSEVEKMVFLEIEKAVSEGRNKDAHNYCKKIKISFKPIEK